MTPTNMRLLQSALLFATALAIPGALHAYVGPGAGLSLLTALWGLVAAIGVAIGFVLMWPIRRMLRRRREAQADALRSDKSSETAQVQPAQNSAVPAGTATEPMEGETVERLAGEVPVAARPTSTVAPQQSSSRH